MSASTPTVPFEAQSDSQTIRDCGAACLSMVYRSFGKAVPRDEIWPAISGRNRLGNVASLTHLMVRDAVTRGFAAVAVQARHPLQALRLCQESGVRAILNHRLSPDTPAGHYTVLVSIDDSAVTLDDPYHGPARRVPHADLLELWQPRFPNSEVMGHLLIGMAAEPSPAAACWLCHVALPVAVTCPHCKQPVALQPNSFLGCIDTACIARMWNYVCCPTCDCGFTVSPITPQAAASSSVVAEPPPSGESAVSPAEPSAAPRFGPEQLSFDRLFAEMDKFCALIRSSPGAAGNPQIQRQLTLLMGTKQSLTLGRAEAIANEKLARAQWDKIAATSRQAAEAHRKKMEELNRPSPPLDGNALGRALMKSLGFTR
jgi:hypothetical protein